MLLCYSNVLGEFALLVDLPYQINLILAQNAQHMVVTRISRPIRPVLTITSVTMHDSANVHLQCMKYTCFILHPTAPRRGLALYMT